MTIRQISAEETIPIRQEVLRKNKPIETCYFTGDDLKNTFHLGVFLNTSLAGICTLVENKKTIQQQSYSYQLRGMAVLEKYRHQQLGKSLMQFLPDFLVGKRIFHVWCNARTSAVAFYEKFGFQSLGNSFEIPEVGLHILMYKIYE